MASYLALYGLDWCFIFSCVILLTWLSILSCYVISLIYGLLHLHKTKKHDEEKGQELPGVSIVKPLINLADPKLIDNLTTFFQLKYPKYELLFCIQDDDQHDLIKVITGLKNKYPNVDTRIFVGADNVLVNPKVNNMLRGYDAAKYPLFMISDAGIQISPDTLTDMVLHMGDKVGLVHQLPYMVDGNLSFSRIMEKVWFGGAQSRIYITANACGVNCMTGMSCLFRKKLLDEEGGLSILGNYLGEDFFLSQLIINKGWHVVLSSQPAKQNPGMSSVTIYKNRMMRWMYLRMSAMPQLYILEPLTENVCLAPLASLAFQYLFSIPFYITLPAHLVVWCVLDYLLTCIIENRRPTYSICSHIRAWIVRETMFVYLFSKVLCMRNVQWGSQKYVVHIGGKTTKLITDSLSGLSTV